MSQDNEELYIERSGSRFRVMTAAQKQESDEMTVVLLVYAVIAIVILVNFGFSPVSFFLLIGSFVAVVFLAKVIYFLVGLFVLFFVGSLVFQLFFG